jgi:thioredoxin 1
MNPLADAASHEWWVICLCAEWCGVCREWRGIFNQAASAHPGFHFAWVDIEDEAQAMGDVDVETFPTLLIAQGASPRFFGPVQPSLAQLSRLLGSLSEAPAAQRDNAEAAALLARIAPRALLIR